VSLVKIKFLLAYIYNETKNKQYTVSLLKTRVELMTGIILFNSLYPCFSFLPDFITMGIVPRMIRQKIGKTLIMTATIVTL